MGYADSGPYRSGVAWPDPVTALHAVAGVLLAYYERESDPERKGRRVETPMIEVQELPKPIADFLEGIWQAFGALPIDRLDQTVMSAAPVEVAMRRKEPSEITVRAMAEFYGAGGMRPQTVTSSGDQRATIPKFHQGKPVNKWVPGQKPGGR